MIELDLKKLSAPDFTASIRPGTPALMVIDEALIEIAPQCFHLFC
jgi:hypothetical protein